MPDFRLKKRLLLVFPFVVLVGALSDCQQQTQKESKILNDTVPLTKHWEKAIPNQVVPEGLISLKAKDCGTCHQEIYQEWSVSTHSIALQDPQFQSEMAKDDIYACLNCHTPLQNQQEYIVTGLINGDYKTPVRVPNPAFDKELQQESITCASCHVRDGYVIGTIGNTKTPHKTIKNAEFLSGKLCISCHNVVDELNPVLVCTFETGDEWKNNWAIKEGQDCISCHMPTKERPLMEGFPKRIGHIHHFPGSGIPKMYGRKTEGLNGLLITKGKLKKTYREGDTVDYKLKLKNNYAGHNIPTGDPERFFLVTFKLIDGENEMANEIEYRIGEKWEWYPVAKKLFDNNLAPKEERIFNFQNIVSKGDYQLFVEVSRHRITEENAAYNGILDVYPLSMKVFQKTYFFKVD